MYEQSRTAAHCQVSYETIIFFTLDTIIIIIIIIIVIIREVLPITLNDYKYHLF